MAMTLVKMGLKGSQLCFTAHVMQNDNSNNGKRGSELPGGHLRMTRVEILRSFCGSGTRNKRDFDTC